MSFQFRIIKKDKNTKARLGIIKTAHGEINTPVFMPVGTRAAVKTLSAGDLKEIGVQVILSNAYHLFLRPGADLIKEAGGLHKFMNWGKPILTDSGGFQIFSLDNSAKITDEGVYFKSIYDGSQHLFTPRIAIEIQQNIGADIIMVLDQCVGYPENKEKIESAMQRTLRWSEECLSYKSENNQALFGIIQGGIYPDLRIRSAIETVKMDFPGIAIGGFSVGEPLDKMFEVIKEFIGIIPEEKPRYLMGVGDPLSMVEAIINGIDMFDCVLPTRLARNGAVMTWHGRINIKNSAYKDDFSLLDGQCGCSVCKTYSKAYIRHLYLNNEILAHRLLTYHNLYFIISIIRNVRKAINEGNLEDYWKDIREKMLD